MKLVPDIYSVPDLLDLVGRGRLALPQFQRDFVWRPSHVVDLLHSVAKRWPIGTFLLLEGPQDFAVRPIDAGPRLTTAELLILDGQQRMTALYQAFRDEGNEVYLVEMGRLLEEKELAEEFVRFERRAGFDKRYPTAKAMADDGIAPVSLVADDTRFFEWLGFVDEKNRKSMLDIRTTFLRGLQTYDIPVVRLPRDVEIEALAKIFETINRTGVRLATFDLMVARLYPHQFNLADEWELAQAVHNETLALFGVDGIELLKLIGLLVHLEERRAGARPFRVKGVRESDVLALSAEVVKRHWDLAVEAYVKALEFLKSHAGVIRAEFVPSYAMVLPIAAVLAIDSAAEAVPRLDDWYWRSIVDQSYAQGANTQTVSDARSMVLNDSEAFSTRSPELDFDALFESRRRNEILVRGILGRLIRDGARDPVSGKALKDIDGPLRIRHVFPRRFVADRGGEPESVLNLLVVSGEAVRTKNDRLPSESIGADAEPWDHDALRSQQCDPQALSEDAYGAFIDHRAKAVFTLVQRAAVSI